MRATFDRFPEVGHAFTLHQVVNVRYEHDAISGRDPEQCDEPDDRRDAEDASREEDARDPADERQRQVDHDQHGVPSPAERQHQQHEQAGEHADTEQPQPPRRRLLALELATVLHAIPRRHRHAARDGGADVINHAAQIAAGHVGRNYDAALHVPTKDHVWSLFPAHIRQQMNRH